MKDAKKYYVHIKKNQNKKLVINAINLLSSDATGGFWKSMNAMYIIADNYV